MKSFTDQLRLQRSIVLILLSIVLVVQIGIQTAGAATGVSVLINKNVYYSVTKAAFTVGTEKQELQFTLRLTNNGSTMVNMNKYGVKVSETGAAVYSPTLLTKSDALVSAKSYKELNYSVQLPLGVDQKTVKVSIFAWDDKQPTFMRTIGSIPIASKLPALAMETSKLTLQLKDLDPAITANLPVVLTVRGSYSIYENGSWVVYTDLQALNAGASSFSLNGLLQMEVIDLNKNAYPASIVYGSETVLLPQRSGLITVKANVGQTELKQPLTLQLYSVKKNPQSVVGKLTLQQTFHSLADKSGAAIVTAATGLKLAVDDKLYTVKNADTDTETAELVTTVTLANYGAASVEVPKLSAVYQLTAGKVAISTADTATAAHPAFLAPGESTSYLYTAEIPTSLNPQELLLVVKQQRDASAAVSFPLTYLPLNTVPYRNAEVADDHYFEVTRTNGSFSVLVKQTNRLTLVDHDVLITELEVTNLESALNTIPTLYAALTSDDLSIDASIVNLQSSAYLTAKQAITIYAVTKVPYVLDIETAELIIGEGTFNTQQQTIANKVEWGTLQLSPGDVSFTPVANGTPWTIAEPGRLSTAQIVNSKIYTNNGSQIVAVSLVQTNKQLRNGNVVAYDGYFVGPDGTYWPAEAAETTGRLCNNCQALSTYSFKLPENGAGLPGQYTFFFGQKLQDEAFISAMQYQIVPDTASATGGSSISLATFPYQYNLSDIKLSFDGGSGIKYKVDFQAAIVQTTQLTGASASKNVIVELVDSADTIINTWSGPIGGASGIVAGANSLLFDLAGKNIDKMVYPKLNIYETFQEGRRLLGTVYLSYGY